MGFSPENIYLKQNRTLSDRFNEYLLSAPTPWMVTVIAGGFFAGQDA